MKKIQFLFDAKLKKLAWIIAILFIGFIGYNILFYTEFKNGYAKVILRSNATLNQNWYCIKEGRKLDRNELFERAAKDLLKKLYDYAHSKRYYNVAQEEWQYLGTKCYFEDTDCQFFSNGKQFDINDIIKQIDLNKSKHENLKKIMQGFNIVRPFEEEKILIGDFDKTQKLSNIKLKYSLLFDYRERIYLIHYDIKFIAIGGYEYFVTPSRFGDYDYGLLVKMYLIGYKDSKEKFDKDVLERWKNDNYFRYEYYPITNCGEVEIRENDNFIWVNE
ncbi:hypothetical protein B6S12_10290 [Helicobacter valdiviensis]|uniref:Uncharacterized protein n=1 Tax=Helicobacter valdiviensis TaxID=1458358 RepID=A0A2W6MVG7_9HELI|nr:hypothetical protein [Helicobacter valdiviensis]PZT47208.1 hypothetical protein B6S12_10290 [Helicobacter valdiviensis]